MYNRNKSANTSYALPTIEVLTLVAVFFLAYGAARLVTEMEPIWHYCWLFVTYTIIYILCMMQSKMYNKTVFCYFDRIFKRLVFSTLVASTVVASIVYYSKAALSRSFFLFFAAFAFMSILLVRFLYRRFVVNNKQKFGERAVLVGNRDTVIKYCAFIDKTSIMTCKAGYVSMEERRAGHWTAARRQPSDMRQYKDRRNAEHARVASGLSYLGSIAILEKIIKEYNIDEVVFCVSLDDIHKINDAARLCQEMGITFRIVLRGLEDLGANSFICSVGTFPVLTYHSISQNNAQLFLKRVVDIFGSVFGILLTMPLMIFAALLIKLDSKGPIFFVQNRIGRNGRRFRMLKFRTMYTDAEKRKAELLKMNKIKDGHIFKMDDDPRITKAGKLLRRTSIDELPQFFNVLVGNMSLVGTRPPTVDEIERYTSVHWKRLCFRPGITGNWQINGRSDVLDFNKIVELDSTYISQWCLSLDFLIMAKTFKAILSRKGAY